MTTTAKAKPAKKTTAKKPVAQKKETVALVEERNLVFHPIVSEKAVSAIDKENTLQFAVLPESNKNQLRSFLEKTYQIKVQSIRTLRDGKGQKKAMVRLVKDQNAREVATKMGVL